MIREAIVVAGGLGTRLRSVVKDIPKPMAPVAGKPFLEYLLDYLKNSGIQKVVLAVGYKAEIIKEYFGNNYEGLALEYSQEEELLGTGGAIKQAFSFIDSNDVLVCNGDTLFKIDLIKFYNYHLEKESYLTIALKEVKRAERYGTVKIDKSGRIVGFVEKGAVKRGLINGGIYLIRTKFFRSLNTERKFSLEKFIEENYLNYPFYGLVFDGYFIDIGIPKDYERAQRELK